MSGLSTRFLQAGVVVSILVALPYKVFELDRFFVPKELTLHIAALLVGVAVLLRARRLTVDAADVLIAFFLAWSILSALFATNHWLAQRALGVTVSGAVVFWVSRKLGAEGYYRPLLWAVGIAAVLAGITSLAQAYGLDSDYFTMNRSPGGTLGNRNFVAHVGAIGLPSLAWCAATSKRKAGVIAGSIGALVIGAALILSRSRAAWLAVAGMIVLVAVPLLASRKHWGAGLEGRRLTRFLLALIAGGILATVLPNRLNWKSSSPYLDSAKGVVDYSRGSGLGRLSQYQNSLRMAAANPVLGVGPGNWPVKYVKFAPSNDLSLSDGITANPWPSSDWVAFVSERGFVGAVALLGVFVVLFLGAFRGWSSFGDGEIVLLKLALVATIVATIVVSAFDVALLLGAPALMVWLVLGAASGARRGGREIVLSTRAHRTAAAIVGLILVVSTVRSAAQIVSMAAVDQGAHTSGWVRGAVWDPGSYRINLRAGQLYANRGRCSLARPYAKRAVGLFPNAPDAKRLVKRCG